jgi:hypothetical protein
LSAEAGVEVPTDDENAYYKVDWNALTRDEIRTWNYRPHYLSQFTTEHIADIDKPFNE